jgi:hypothetical protein
MYYLKVLSNIHELATPLIFLIDYLFNSLKNRLISDILWRLINKITILVYTHFQNAYFILNNSLTSHSFQNNLVVVRLIALRISHCTETQSVSLCRSHGLFTHIEFDGKHIVLLSARWICSWIGSKRLWRWYNNKIIVYSGFDSRRYQIFCEVVGLERGPLSLVRINEELLEWKSSCSGRENRINGRVNFFFIVEKNL